MFYSNSNWKQWQIMPLCDLENNFLQQAAVAQNEHDKTVEGKLIVWNVLFIDFTDDTDRFLLF